MSTNALVISLALSGLKLKNITESFFSIFAIVFLGAAFFAGLRNTPGTMTKSMDAFLDQYHYADLTYMASLGFSKEDILKRINNNYDGITEKVGPWNFLKKYYEKLEKYDR